MFASFWSLINCDVWLVLGCWGVWYGIRDGEEEDSTAATPWRKAGGRLRGWLSVFLMEALDPSRHFTTIPYLSSGCGVDEEGRAAVGRAFEMSTLVVDLSRDGRLRCQRSC